MIHASSTPSPRGTARLLAPLCLPFALLLSAAAAEPATEPRSEPMQAPPAASGSQTKADPRVDWLRQNAVRLRSVSPADRDFADLQPLRQILAGKRMVLLGEPSHGDGTAFLAKIRLIEFLHQELGYDVLAFESGLYDCRKVDEALRRGDDPVKAVRRGLFAIWSRSEQLLPLMDYLGKAATGKPPLEVAGFDNQFTGAASAEDLVKDLKAFANALGSEALRGPAGAAFGEVVQKLIDGVWEEGGTPLPSGDEQRRFLERGEALRKEIRATLAAPPRPGAPPTADSSFWLQLLESNAALARLTWDPDQSTAEGRTRVRTLRDRQMARNLLWLANARYPGRKIVVWAATFHAARNLRTIDLGTGRPELTQSYRTMETMGDGVAKELKKEMYALAITAYEGSVGNALQTRPPEPLDRPSPGSLEELMAQAGLENALVDFRDPAKGGAWLRQPLVSRPLGYTEMKADWGEIVDGMLFLKTMAPSTRAAR